MPSQYYYKQSKRVTLITIWMNSSLALLKIVVGILGNSHALLADGIHSLADLLSAFLVLIAARLGAAEADLNHPYGHDRIETAGALGLACLIGLTGCGIVFDGIAHLSDSSQIARPSILALIVAITALISNEWLFRFSLKIATKLKSSLLIANAWHSRSDAAASAVVVVGVGGSLLGFQLLDAVGATIVGAMIIKMGIQLIWQSISELIDTGLDPESLELLRTAIIQVPGIEALHQMRSRSMNGRIFLDLHVQVEPFLTVSEGHYLGNLVDHAVRKVLPQVIDVTVHVDPEDDEVGSSRLDLPLRTELLALLPENFQQMLAADPKSLRLHYLQDQLVVEVFLPQSRKFKNSEITLIEEKLSTLPAVHEVIIWHRDL